MWLTVFLVFHLLCAAPAASRLAVVRPFAVADTPRLVPSFDAWNVHLPCGDSPGVPVDLFLCFSQDLANDTGAALATQTIVQDWQANQTAGTTWHHCFANVRVISADLASEDDTYQPLQANEHSSKWVRGPNKQFLTMALGFQNNTWGEYDAWFLMEMDCIPRRSGWLTDLLSEVEARRPVAVLGSFYRGDMWDKLAMPPAIHLHINGNALYNHSSPLLQAMIADLAADIDADRLTAAFDVRLAELYLNSTLPAEQFGWYAGDSAVIGNYAHTPMLEQYYNNEPLVHGGWLYETWQGTATLLVSDFGDVDASGTSLLEMFQDSLLRGHHPFRSVVVVRPAGSALRAPYSLPLKGIDMSGSVEFLEVERNASGWLDWCITAVPDPWFLYTNVYFDFARRIDLLQAVGTDLPVIGFVPANSSFCSNTSACPYAVQRAANFSNQTVAVHYDLSQTLFQTSLRDAFCESWREWDASRALAADVCEPIPGPTADDYMAYLAQQGVTGLFYNPVNSLQQGQRSRGVLRVTPHDSRPCAFAASMPNASACDFASDAASCVAIPGCSFHTSFGTCFNGTLPAVVQPPSFSVFPVYKADCQGDLVVPAFQVNATDKQQYGIVFTNVSIASVADNTSTAVPRRRPGTAQLVTTKTAPQLWQSIPFTAYDVSGLAVHPDVNRTVRGRRFTLTAPLPFAVRITPPPQYVSPITIMRDGWVSSIDSSNRAIIVDTTGSYSSALTVEGQLTTVIDGVTVVACSNSSEDILPAPVTQCSATVTVNPATAIGGSNIDAAVSSFSFWVDQNSIVSYSWTVAGGLPIVTSTAMARLEVPYFLVSTNVSVAVTAWDVYNRTQTCTADLLVLPSTFQDVVSTSNSMGCTGSTITTSGDLAITCLQLVGALAAENSDNATQVQVRDMAAAMLTNLASSLPPTTTDGSNALLAQLAALTDSGNYGMVDDEVQSHLVDVLVRLSTTDDHQLDSSSVGKLIAVVGPLLQNIVAATSAIPSYSVANGTVTNATLARQNAERLNAVLDSTLNVVARSIDTLYTTMSHVDPGHCINATWALQTNSSLYWNGDFQDFSITQTLASVLPATVRFALVSLSHDCNSLRDELHSAAQLRRLTFLDATGQQLTDDYFSQQGVSTKQLWRTRLVFEAPPYSSGSITNASFSRLLHTKFQPQAETVTQYCQQMDANGLASTFAPMNGYCFVGLPGTVTGTWTSRDRLIIPGDTSSPSPAPADSTTSSSFDLATHWWVIVVPVVAVLALLGLAAIVFYFSHHRQRDAGSGISPVFESVVPRPPQNPLEGAWAEEKQWSPPAYPEYPERTEGQGKGAAIPASMGPAVPFRHVSREPSPVAEVIGIVVRPPTEPAIRAEPRLVFDAMTRTALDHPFVIHRKSMLDDNTGRRGTDAGLDPRVVRDPYAHLQPVSFRPRANSTHSATGSAEAPSSYYGKKTATDICHGPIPNPLLSTHGVHHNRPVRRGSNLEYALQDAAELRRPSADERRRSSTEAWQGVWQQHWSILSSAETEGAETYVFPPPTHVPSRRLSGSSSTGIRRTVPRPVSVSDLPFPPLNLGHTPAASIPPPLPSSRHQSVSEVPAPDSRRNSGILPYPE